MNLSQQGPATNAAGLIEISPRLHESIAVWPGDEPLRRRVSCDMQQGDHLTLSSLHATVHLGAHADAPNHYARDGEGIGACPLEPYWGTCQVISPVRDLPAGSRILPEHFNPLKELVRAPRVLVRTLSYPNPDHFNHDFSALSPELIFALAALDVCLVGIDTPSVDLCDDKVLHTHNALAETRMAVLEGLVLQHVSDGCYHLAALPLRLEGFDASPVRAVLQTLPSSLQQPQATPCGNEKETT